MMIPVAVGEALEPGRGDRVQDVAVEAPFEEAEEQVHPEEGDQQGHAAGGELVGPHAGEEQAEGHQQ